MGSSGIGLIGAGLTVVNVQARRADQAELINKLDELIEAREAGAGRAGHAAQGRPASAPLEAAGLGQRRGVR